jgi:hypothetical protein
LFGEVHKQHKEQNITSVSASDGDVLRCLACIDNEHIGQMQAKEM